MSTFSPRLVRRARIAAGYDRPEVFAVVIGRSVESVRGYELGKTTPSISMLTRIAEATGRDVLDFFEDE